MKAYKIPCSPTRSPLPGIDFCDSFALDVSGALTAGDAAKLALGRMPAWVQALMTVRNALVAPFGLKHDIRQFEADSIGIFPVVSHTSNRVVLGFDDRHLDFRITIDTVVRTDIAGASCTTVTASTWVKTHNLFGRLYLAGVKPFHNVIVPTALNQLLA